MLFTVTNLSRENIKYHKRKICKVY